MIEVKDEVLNGEPLYRIRNKEGNVILDNVTFEMITEVLQSGTPLNKALFDSIKNYIDNIIPNNYVVGTVTPTSESSLTITCGFLPTVVLILPYSVKYAPCDYFYVIVGDRGFSIDSDGDNSPTTPTLTETGCTIGGSFNSTSNMYRYIAFKG